MKYLMSWMPFLFISGLSTYFALTLEPKWIAGIVAAAIFLRPGGDYD